MAPRKASAQPTRGSLLISPIAAMMSFTVTAEFSSQLEISNACA